MKYVLIVVAVLLLVKIDLVLHIFDRAYEKINAPEAPSGQEVSTAPPEDTISISEDGNLQLTPRKSFLILLEDFHANPVDSVSTQALDVLKANPNLFNEKLDPQLEAAIFSWRDLIPL